MWSDSRTFSAEEMAFMAEDTTVTIVPNFSLPAATGGFIRCIAGSFGPFSPNLPVDVPLWLALALHGMKRCRLLPPEWLSPAALAAVDEAERASGSRFEPLPEGFLEVGRLLLTRCRGEFETREYDEISGLLESVRSARYGKLRDGIGQLTGPMAVKLTNITASELNAVRPFFLGALTAFAAVTAPPGREGNNGAAPAVEAAAETAEAAPAAAATAPPPPASWSQQPQQQSQSQRFRTRNRD